jgi:hypothetical protein
MWSTNFLILVTFVLFIFLYFEIPHLQSVFCDFAEFNAMQVAVMIVAY